MRRFAALLIVLAGCGEDPAAAPVHTSGPRTPIQAEEPSPFIVQPHVRRTEHGRASASSAVPLRRGGGGGGGFTADDLEPRHAPMPSDRDVAAFRERLEREMAERPAEDGDDACDRWLAVIRATTAANARPGQPAAEPPTRAQLRESCNHLPAAYRDCLSPEHFRENMDECQQEFERMAARGQRLRDASQRRFDDIEAGRASWPGQRGDEMRQRGPRPPREDG